jgi:hypothetical protein
MHGRESRGPQESATGGRAAIFGGNMMAKSCSQDSCWEGRNIQLQHDGEIMHGCECRRSQESTTGGRRIAPFGCEQACDFRDGETDQTHERVGQCSRSS